MQQDPTKPPASQSDPRLKDWPKMTDYPQTEDGYNEYQDAWVARRRRAAGLGNIPMAAIEEHRAAVAKARERGWQEIESG